jgi:hypothetical protein
MEPLSYDDFKALALARRRAFHLEQKDTYNVESEESRKTSRSAAGSTESPTTTHGTPAG